MARKLNKGAVKILKGTSVPIKLWGDDLKPAPGQTVTLLDFSTTNPNWRWQNATLSSVKTKFVIVTADLIHLARSLADDDADLNVTLDYTDTGNLDQTYDVTYSDEGFGTPPSKSGASARRLRPIQLLRGKAAANGKPRPKTTAPKSSQKKTSKKKTTGRKKAASKRR
jgi:hypothetical protein